MPRAKSWAQLTRRQRREYRARLRNEIILAERCGYLTSNPGLVEALRAALAELREPRKGER